MPALNFEAIGTQWTIETNHTLSDALQKQLHQRIAAFDQTYSRFRHDSLVAKLRVPGTYEFPDDAGELLAFYQQLYDATDGQVTPLIGDALERVGYDAEYSLVVHGKARPAMAWKDAMTWQDTTVTVAEPIVLDVGAAGKGYLVDIIGAILEEQGIAQYVIDASGDIRHRGKDVQRIGFENPYDPARVLGVAEVQNASLCASSMNRRQWGEWHHILDPRTGRPTHGVVATWVIAESTMVADGLATALFFVKPERLTQWDFQSVRLFADGRIEKTQGFVGELFI